MPVWINNKNKKNLRIQFTDDTIIIADDEGREAVLMLAFYPEFLDANEEQKMNWELSADEHTIRWKDIDTEISINGLLG